MAVERKVIPMLPSARYEAGLPSPYHENPPHSRSPDAEMSVSGQRLRDWARHLADNSSVINAVLSSRVSNAIGPGLTYEPLCRDRKGNLLTELNDAIKRIHGRWSRSVDVAGEYSRQEIERLAWRTWDIDGECFLREVMRRSGRESVPYALQIIDAEWIPYQLIQNYRGEYIVHGIAKDEWGRPLRYYIDPNDFDIYSYPGQTFDPSKIKTIPADQMVHLKRVKRPNQTRGVTLIHAVIFRVTDIAEFQEAHRLAARASADLFASVNRSPDFSGESDEDSTGKRKWDFEHLQILDELQAGETVNFHSPQHPNQNAVDFINQELRAIAAGCDVGFSQIAQVFDSSYAAQRREVVDTWRKVERDRSQFIADFARPALYERVVEIARLGGLLPARAMRRVDPETLLDCRIDGPTMPVIDPNKDRQAFELDQVNGWDSRHGIIRRMGRQPADVDAERASDTQLPARDREQPAVDDEDRNQ